MTPDPIGLEGGINLFAYVQNNPINAIDPFGLSNDPLGLSELREILVRIAPDYISLNINVGIPWTANLIGWSGQVALDRYGNLYWAPFGGTVGKSWTFVSGSLTGGWLHDCGTKPSEDRMKNFLSRSSINAGGGTWFAGGNYTWVPGSGTATEIGFFSPQIGASYHYSWQKWRLPVSW